MGKSWGSSSWLRALKRAFRAPTQKRICGPREVVVENDEVEKKRGKGRSAFRKPPNQENAALHQSCHERTISTTSKVSTRRAATTAAVRRSEEEDVVRVAMATAVAAQAAVATAKAALQALPLIRPPIDHRREYCAAVVIQTAFRGYLSRRALRALKGLVKLQALVRGNNVRKQVEMTLQCMQSLVRVQDQVCKQRRRLPLEGSFCWSSNGSFDRKLPLQQVCQPGVLTQSRDRISAPHDRIDDCQLHNLEKIKSMFEQLKEINLQSEEDPAFTFSQQEWRDLARHQLDSEEEPAVKELRRHNQWVARSSKSRTSCDRGDAVKMIKIDTRTNYSTPISQESPFKWKDAIHEKHSASPHLVSDHWNRHELPQTPTYNATSNLRSSSPSSGAQPNYMAATASAMAKSRSQSTPKQRFLTLERERPQSARKRLSFPAPDESGNLDRDFDRCLSRPTHQESHGFGHNWRNDLSS